MELALIAAVALFASVLTFFSGFGLGTLLTPVFALFFPLPVAIAVTALVHLANNVFKFALMARHIDWPTVMRFGVPATFGAFGGAYLLGKLDAMPPWLVYSLGANTFQILPIKGTVGLAIILFSLAELSSRIDAMSFSKRWLVVGGGVSGFFGGLSGNQGALRSAFLSRIGLDPGAFVATGVSCAVIVDVVRLGVYGVSGISMDAMSQHALAAPFAVATASAFAGAYLGSRMLKKMKIKALQRIVAAMLLAIGTGLIGGWI